MRTLSDILDRAFTLLLLADRGLLERQSHAGGTYSLAEREDKRAVFQNIIESRSLCNHLTDGEANHINTPVGQLPDDFFWATQHQFEAIPILLWVAGLQPFPSYLPDFNGTDYHNVLGKYRTERWRQKPVLQQESDVRTYYGVVFLWHWRVIEGRGRDVFKTADAFDLIRNIFGDEFDSAFQYIEVASEKPCDFVAGKHRYNELEERSANTLRVVSTWRHHALEWVLGSDSWDATETNT
jgi:hypothetical protein